jgi:hypothetical protein
MRKGKKEREKEGGGGTKRVAEKRKYACRFFFTKKIRCPQLEKGKDVTAASTIQVMSPKPLYVKTEKLNTNTQRANFLPICRARKKLATG